MWNDTAKLLKRAAPPVVKYALRGVGGNDNHERLELAYRVEDPWNMDSAMERSRFEATNRVIEQAFGRVGSVLEIGCGEGHQTQHLARISDEQYGLDVSPAAIERARLRLATGAFRRRRPVPSSRGASWRHRFDLVTACEVLYYLN